MVGGTEAHNLLVSNLHVIIGAAIKGTGCRSFVANMKVRVEATNSFYYPDLMVTCKKYSASSLYKTSPRLIVEVLSPSTMEIDRREKLAGYQSIDTLLEYLIVYQDQRRVELDRRNGNSEWHVTLFERQDFVVLRPTESTEIDVGLDDIYDGVIA